MASPNSTTTERIWTTPSDGFVGVTVPVQVTTTDFTKGWYYAYQLGYGVAGELNAYIGLQTQGAGVGNVPAAIMAVWSDSTEARSPGFASSFAGEGFGFTVMIPFAWTTGVTYNLTMRRIPRSGRLKNALWIGGWVDSTFIGKIRVPDITRGVGWWTVQWTEFYTAAPTCGDIPPSEVLWSPPVADGVPPLQSNFNVGTGQCTGSFNDDIGGGVSRERMRWP
jgi:hypothetical protein